MPLGAKTPYFFASHFKIDTFCQTMCILMKEDIIIVQNERLCCKHVGSNSKTDVVGTRWCNCCYKPVDKDSAFEAEPPRTTRKSNSSLLFSSSVAPLLHNFRALALQTKAFVLSQTQVAARVKSPNFRNLAAGTSLWSCGLLGTHTVTKVGGPHISESCTVRGAVEIEFGDGVACAAPLVSLHFGDGIRLIQLVVMLFPTFAAPEHVTHFVDKSPSKAPSGPPAQFLQSELAVPFPGPEMRSSSLKSSISKMWASQPLELSSAIRSCHVEHTGVTSRVAPRPLCDNMCQLTNSSVTVDGFPRQLRDNTV